jgi:glucose/arabinose dehydrogenase
MPIHRLVLLGPLALSVVLACSDHSLGGSGPPPPPADSTLVLTPVVSGLNRPVFLTAPAGDPRMFVLEKDGRIRIIENGALLPAPFLDITGLTTRDNEQGLLGLAFAPDYATSGRFYIYFTSPGQTGGGNSIVARYHVSADPDLADPAGDTLLVIAQPYTNHNGGMLAFGPDGMLYIGLGDGGSGGDPDGHGQDRTELLGSILRIDVSGTGYSSPAGNPFAGSPTFRHELWSYGLRNPWRFSFDRQTGDLYIGDVGQNALEEIDVQPAGDPGGENYGWNIMEGLSCYGGGTCNKTGLTLPVLDYPHSQGCSVTGGYVYRGTALPLLQGTYFYADYCAGMLRSFRWTGSGITGQKDWTDLVLSGGVTSFGEDSSGELYALTDGGTVYRFSPP